MVDFARVASGSGQLQGAWLQRDMQVGFAEELVDQVGAAWCVPPITRDERAAYLRLFEDVGMDTAEIVVRGCIVGTRPTRPSPEEIATAASERRVQTDGDEAG